MNRKITIIACVAACLTLGACESTTTTADVPEQRLDVSVDGRTATDATPSSATESRPSTRVDRTPDPVVESVPQPRDIAVETTQAPPVMASPVRSEPARTSTTRTNPAPASATPPQQWWLSTPDPAPGRIRIVAKGGGATLPAARQAAVDAGREQLTRLRGSAPEDLEFEKTQAFPRAGGVYEAFVLISCER